MTLYRPVGLKEFELVKNLGFRAFPPRLPIQPIFYPVLNAEYATFIAREWNTKDPVSDYIGFVLQFEVDDEYASKFEVQTVGSRVHQELWVPAEELEEFNRHIVGRIRIIATFTGESFSGELSALAE